MLALVECIQLDKHITSIEQWIVEHTLSIDNHRLVALALAALFGTWRSSLQLASSTFHTKVHIAF